MSITDKEDSRKHKKKDKKEHHKSSKHHKKDKDSKRDRHSHKKHSKDKDRDRDRDKDRSHKEKEHKSHGDKHKSQSDVSIAQIDEDDYFLKNEEFRVWLHVDRSIPFEDLTTVQARELFTGAFCKDWNRGSLASMFYSGTIPTELRQQCVKSAHKWGIKLSEKEKEQASDLGNVQCWEEHQSIMNKPMLSH